VTDVNRAQAPQSAVFQSRFSGRRFVVAMAMTAVGLLLSFVVLVGKPKPQPRAPEPPRVPMVDVVTATPTTHRLSVLTQGTVEAQRQINVVAQVSGKVVSVSAQFADGTFFSAGDRLLQIETDDYEFAIARAKAQLAASEQRLAEERGRAFQARREWRDLGAEEANALFLRQPQLRAAEAAVEAAQADLDAAQLALTRTTIVAPFDGRLAAKRADIGQFVAAGSPVATLYATDQLEVRLPLSDSQLAILGPDITRLHLDDGAVIPVTVSADFAGQRWQWSATVRRTESMVDPTSRIFYAVAEIDDTTRDELPGRPPLVPGMYVEAALLGQAQDAVIQLPATALRGDNTVLIVSDQDRLQRRAVHVIQRQVDEVWVRGLQAGERVVAAQSSALTVGMTVDTQQGS
jgi:RND family efflux transporter MFP subunit